MQSPTLLQRIFLAQPGDSSLAIGNIIPNLALAVLYFGVARAGLAITFEAEQVSVIWPPTGLALAALLLFGYRLWPGIAFGAFIANIVANEPTITAFGIALGNTLEAATGAWLLRRFGFNNQMLHPSDVLNLLLSSAVISTMISATIGVTSLCAGGVQPWASYGLLWRIWWVGDATGALIVAPLLLTWGSRQPALWQQRNVAEAVLLLALMSVVCMEIFTTSSINGHTFVYIVFPFIILAALRLQQQGVTAATVIASATAIWATLHNTGPFSGASVEHNLILLQIFMGVVSMTGLLLSATVARSRNTEAELREGKTRLAAELEVMNDLYHYNIRLASSPHLQAALIEVLDASIKITQADFGNIQILNPEGKGLRIVAHRGFKQDFLDHFKYVPIEEGTSVCARAAHMGGRLIVKDVEQDPEFAEHREIARSAGFRAVQSTPLFSAKGMLLGMLSTHFREPQLPSELNFRMLDLYALQAASLIERMRVEEALQLADARKNNFLAVLAHELRNPLAPIKNSVDILKLSADTAIRAQAENIIERQIKHMIHLIDDLMDVSRITRDKIELRKQPTKLQDIINCAVETSDSLIKKHGHELAVHLPEDPVWLDADFDRVSQIFSNLLNNAAKYTPNGGRIEVNVKKKETSVVISVRDNGIGIPENMLQRIFDMFSQVDSSLDRSQGGLGIGLTLAKRLIEMHGGNITVSSPGINGGSEFLVTLPIRAAPRNAVQDAVQKASVSDKNNRKVLVVDDSEVSAQTMQQMLKLLGHQVYIAHDGFSAIETARKHQPEIVILDVGLPGMDGYETCKRMKGEPSLKHTLFVAHTGWGQSEHRKLSQEAGFDFHLVKPIHLDELRNIMNGAA
jgi:signal transduction histidine kinase/integral membrane sensor domain MASE1